VPVSVSVVVPVYNPGPYFEACLASLLRQTMPSDRYEIVLVDDGSTDGTAQRLDRAASRHPKLITVIHTENSGWAGRPRNLGNDAATGDYVMFVDDDDWLLPHALEVLHERAVLDDSDIVIGRSIGNRRAVPAAIFDQGDFCTTWRKTPGLFNSLMATHKLFLRSFLREHHLRFPEGRVRLEDQIMVTRAYLEARRVSIVGNRPCYVHERRDDLGNLTAQPIDPVDYFRSVRAVVNNFLAATEPGPERAIALTRTLGGEIIGRVDGRNYLDQKDDYRALMFEQVRQVMLADIDERTDQRLAPVLRVRAAFVRLGDRVSLEQWVEWSGGISAAVELANVAWDGTRLRVDVRAHLELDDVPLHFPSSGKHVYLPRPTDMDLQTDPRLREAADVTKHLPMSGVVLLLRSRDYMEEWRISAANAMRVEPAGPDEVAVRWTATATFDPSTAAAGAPLRPGIWDVYIRIDACGLRREHRLRSTTDTLIEVPVPAVLGTEATTVVPFLDPHGGLSIDVDQWVHSLAKEVIGRGVQPPASDQGKTLRLSLQLLVLCEREVHAEVLLLPRRWRSTGPQLRIGKVIAGSDGHATLEVPLTRLRPGGRWSVHLRFGGPGTGMMQATGLDLLRLLTGRFAVRHTLMPED
jgi:poly(ribitol-phosphate) beta-N-acetylglucosaminyltransferase